MKHKVGGLEKIDMATFDIKLLSGEQLVVLDDLVLEVGDYMKTHPGGSEVLEKNIGRDVSKFFYGGYSMSKHSYPYAHTQSAVKVMSTLVKYRLTASVFGTDQVAQTFVAVLSSRTAIVPNVIHTVTFKAANKVIGLQKHYSDIDMIGRHFLV